MSLILQHTQSGHDLLAIVAARLDFGFARPGPLLFVLGIVGSVCKPEVLGGAARGLHWRSWQSP